MPTHEHQRHKPPTALTKPRALVVACEPMRSNINLSRILRACGCCGVPRVICCGTAKVIGKIARDSNETVRVDTHRTLAPMLQKLQAEGYRLVGLEQASDSHNLHAYAFPRRTVLVIGNERQGITPDVLTLMDDVVEIPVYGRPFSYNAATAAAIGLYEYCRQFPEG